MDSQKFRKVTKIDEEYKEIVKSIALIQETMSVNGISPTTGMASMMGLVTALMHDSDFSYEEYYESVVQMAKYFKYMWEEKDVNANQ